MDLCVLGRYDEEGVLRAVARSTPLHPDRGRRVGAWLTPGRAGHARDGVRCTASWRSQLDVRLVEPGQLAEMSMDTRSGRRGEGFATMLLPGALQGAATVAVD